MFASNKIRRFGIVSLLVMLVTLMLSASAVHATAPETLELPISLTGGVTHDFVGFGPMTQVIDNIDAQFNSFTDDLDPVINIIYKTIFE